MKLINRDVVIIKPKEPFVEWINRSWVCLLVSEGIKKATASAFREPLF